MQQADGSVNFRLDGQHFRSRFAHTERAGNGKGGHGRCGMRRSRPVAFGQAGKVRTSDALHAMQVRYDAALPPPIGDYAARLTLRCEQAPYLAQFLAYRRWVQRLRRCFGRFGRGCGCRAGTGRCAGLASDLRIEPMPRTVDREALLVEEIANAPDQQHFVVLIVAAVAAALHRLELCELLFPVAQHVRLDRA